jgi:hypothetical protein
LFFSLPTVAVAKVGPFVDGVFGDGFVEVHGMELSKKLKKGELNLSRFLGTDSPNSRRSKPKPERTRERREFGLSVPRLS